MYKMSCRSIHLLLSVQNVHWLRQNVFYFNYVSSYPGFKKNYSTRTLGGKLTKLCISNTETQNWYDAQETDSWF